MESNERERILRLAQNNFQLKRLYSRHCSYEEKITPFLKRKYLTTQEEVELKRLKFEKLRGKEQMMQILESAA